MTTSRTGQGRHAHQSVDADGAPILVVACGNLLAGDDALGPRVADQLQHRFLPGMDVVSLDLRPAGLVDHLLAPRRALIVADAVIMPDTESGTIIETEWRSPDRPALANDDVLSTHGLSIGNQIELADRLSMLPERVYLVGMVIGGASIGQDASGFFDDGVVAVADRIVSLTNHWLAEVQHA